jgi:hypothetical protein
MMLNMTMAMFVILFFAFLVFPFDGTCGAGLLAQW